MSRPTFRRTTGMLLAIVFAACDTSQTPPSTAVSPDPSQSAAPTAVESTVAPSVSPYAGLWEDATASTIGATEDWTNKVEIADLDGDRLPDILFANGAAYETPGPPVANRIFLNGGPGQRFEDATTRILGDLETLTRVIKVRDLNADGLPDIVLGATYQRQSQLFLGAGEGRFELATDLLPPVELSLGDLEVGDVDADGDLDMVLADWGVGSPMENTGGRVQLWRNDGSGRFTDVTAAAMPDTLVRFSWELELLDVDNDWDLDVAVSAKRSDTSFLFTNDGTGTFTDVTADRMPHFTNNYEFEAMDLDADGFLDLVTINDGPDIGRGFQEHVFRNDGSGAYVDVTPEWWPNEANVGEDDNIINFLDVDSDGDADFIVGSLTGAERLLINDGAGHLSLVTTAFNVAISAGTLGMAVADLNADGRPDVVDAQGENPAATDERVYLATERLAADTAPPIIRTDLVAGARGIVVVHARVIDGMSASAADQQRRVEVRWDGADAPLPLAWYGEFLFRGSVTVPDDVTGLQVCATDQVGNEACVAAG
jgi:hypothetical protein